MLQTRYSVVKHLFVNSISTSSVCQIGDSKHLAPLTHAIAVQREKEIFYTAEGNFQAYSIFTKEIPIPPITERINIRSINKTPTINVNTIRITAISSSSIIHIGATQTIKAEARVKNIRHLEPRE